MGTKVHYPAETKWKAVQMREEGYSQREVMDTLGIQNVTQLKTWMKWYRNGETHRFHQPVGKQYTFGKGPSDLSEIEKAVIALCEKLNVGMVTVELPQPCVNS